MLSGFPGGSAGKGSINAGDTGSILGSGRTPWRRKWKPTPVLLPGKFHGQRSLEGHSPWGHKVLDTTECAHTHTHTHTHIQNAWHTLLFQEIIGQLLFQEILVSVTYYI